MKKILVLYNRAAGTGKKKLNVIEKLIQRLEKDKLDYVIEEPKANLELMYKYKDELNKFTDIVICGGDGTINNVVNFLYLEEINYTIIPIGSGNDFYTSIFGAINYDKAIDRVFSSRIRKIDIAKANDRLFVNSAGTGIDAHTDKYINKLRKVFSSGISYKLSAIMAIIDYKPKNAKILIDGDIIEEKVHIIVCANNKNFGGGMIISPNSKPDDNLLELILLKKTTLYNIIRLFIKIFKGKHLGDKNIIYLRGKEIDIFIDEQDFQVEGEIVGKTPIKIRLVNSKFNLKI